MPPLNKAAAVAADADTDMEFSASFADFSKPEEEPVASNDDPKDGAPAAEAPPEEPAAAEPPAEEPPAAEPPAEEPPAAEPPAEQPPAEEPPLAAEAPAPAADTDAVLKKLADLVAEKPKVEAPAAEAPAAEAEPERPLYTSDETELITNYQKEWPEQAAAEKLIRRGEYRGMIQYVFGEVMREFAPVKQLAATLAQRQHITDLEGAIGQYDDLLHDDLTAWIGTQPAYLQDAYNKVIGEGTVEDVADLVDRFKKATGKQASKPSKKDTELSEEAKQAANSLAPVGSKRSVIPAVEDNGDFDAGWAKFASM